MTAAMTAPREVVPVHPQACPGDPQSLRWVSAGSPLRAGVLPEPLASLVAQGLLASVEVRDDGVLTRLAPGRSWVVDGPRVRTAVHAALAARPQATEAPDDERLAAVVRELLDGPVGAVAASHGGTIQLVEARDGIVQVRLDGACDGCPAAGVTLRLRLEDELRRRCPDLRAVRAVGGRPARADGRLFGSISFRSRAQKPG
jgi:NFU1 iron-sulfur cluster scaffold homolog, mitochondrial